MSNRLLFALWVAAILAHIVVAVWSLNSYRPRPPKCIEYVDSKCVRIHVSL